MVPNRHGAIELNFYRYGFQGQEKDDEIKGGEGKSLNYTFRMHDPRVGRFFAVDPLFKEYPELSTYQFSSNSPIDMVELEGMEGGWFVENNKAVYHQGYAYIKGFDSEEAALKAAARGFKTPKEQANAEKSLQQWLSRTPKVQRSVETLRCACAVCFQKANSNHYLAAHDPVMRESAMYILTGGTANFLFKALPKVKIITKAGEAYSKLSVREKVTYKVGFNVASQTIANKGDIKKVNVVEAIASGIKGRPAVILGESAKLSVQDALDGRIIPEVKLNMKTATQVTGGLLSDSYGNATNNYLKGEKGGEIVGEAAKFFVETVSNIAPDVMFPDDYKINN